MPSLLAAAKDPQGFVRAAKLRRASELEAMEAALYRQHWRVRDALLAGKPVPRTLNPRIVCERRYALSWVVGWGDDWESVSSMP
jgi:hypothetical protein